MKKMDYEVGYGKPPKKTQWKKGQSGNPSGKTKGTKGAKTLGDHLAGELMKPVEVSISGKKQKMSKGEAIAISLVNAAISGPTKEKLLIIEKFKAMGVLEKQALLIEDSDCDDIPELTEEERKLLDFSKNLIIGEDGE